MHKILLNADSCLYLLDLTKHLAVTSKVCFTALLRQTLVVRVCFYGNNKTEMCGICVFCFLGLFSE